MARGAVGGPSGGPSNTDSSTLVSAHAPTLRASPPPRWRQAPVSAGRHASARKNMAPCSWCSAPMSVRMNAGVVVP